MIITRENCGFFMQIKDRSGKIIDFIQKKGSYLDLINWHGEDIFSTELPVYQFYHYLDDVLSRFHLPSLQVKNTLLRLFTIPKRWKYFIPLVKQLCVEIAKTDWDILVCCHKNNMLDKSESFLWSSLKSNQREEVIKICVNEHRSNLGTGVASIISDYAIDLDDHIITCLCGTNHTDCSSIRVFDYADIAMCYPYRVLPSSSEYVNM
jgi:hypothetical protein